MYVQSFYSFYHISHLTVGFIGVPSLQWNSSENSGKLDNVPITRNCGGECGSFSICKFVVSSVTAEHHTYYVTIIIGLET